jgi:hypothetical protein
VSLCVFRAAKPENVATYVRLVGELCPAEMMAVIHYGVNQKSGRIYLLGYIAQGRKGFNNAPFSLIYLWG